MIQYRKELVELSKLVGSLLGATCFIAFASANTTLRFPDESVGVILSRPQAIGDFGYDLNSAVMEGWEPIGPARGKVTVPDGHCVRLELNRAATRDLSWVDALGPKDVTQLIASRIDLNDQGFAKIARLSGLQYLDVNSNKLTNGIGRNLVEFSELRTLWVSYMPGVGDKLMAEVAAMPKLEEVGIWETSVTDSGLSALAESRTLRAVYAGRTHITDKGVAALVKMPTLRAIRLTSAPEDLRRHGERYPEITDAGVEALCSRPELEMLDLTGSRISDESLVRMAYNLRRMKHLVLDRTPITRKGLSNLRDFKSLERLRCYQLSGDGPRFDDVLVASLVGMNKLKVLRADLEITDRGVASLAKLPSLESLTLSGAEITDASMVAIASMPSLRSLSLQHTSVTDDGFAAIAGSRVLERAQINGICMTTRCIETLVTLPNLKQVGLKVVKPRIDGKPVWKSIGGLHNLEQELWLIDCPALSSEDFAAIAQFHRLKNLRIEGGGVLGDSELLQIARNEQLETITLDSTVATDQGITALAELPRLRSVVLGCVATDDGLRELARSPSLRWLTLASPNMTDDAFDSVRASCKQLESLARREFRLASQVVSKSKLNRDAFWRLGALGSRIYLDELENKIAPAIAADQWTNTDDAISLGDLYGKVVLVDFWGSWCGPCLAQLPKILQLRDKYAERGLVVIGIHSSQGSEEGKRYVEENNVDWPIGFDDSKQTEAAYHVSNWPSVYLIDKRGVLRLARPLPDELDTAIQSLLAE